ncbi:MAG: NAD(P)-dependent oxidoreductase [Rhodocyclaceae bacterium]|nr:NAD(P)-dependent oxidoreductase [Rhodocyclaceae bacterium]
MLNHAVFETACEDITSLMATRPLTELHGMRVFATGCTGFFGYWLLSAITCLNRHGAKIEVVALSRNPAKFLQRHPEFSDAPWLSFVTGTIVDFRLGVTHFDAVIHAATDTSPEAAAKPMELLADITAGTQNFLAQVSTTGYRRFLFVSSGAVYGEQTAKVEPISEASALPDQSENAANAYGHGKRIAEALCITSAQANLPAPVIARCFAFIGPYLPEHLAPAQFVRDLIDNDEIILQGDGTPLRSYLDAGDLALWLLSLLARGAAGSVYNVGGTTPVSIAELATTIRDALRPRASVTTLGTAPNAPRQRYVPDTTRAREELNLLPWTPLTQSIQRMAAAMESAR